MHDLEAINAVVALGGLKALPRGVTVEIDDRLGPMTVTFDGSTWIDRDGNWYGVRGRGWGFTLDQVLRVVDIPGGVAPFEDW